MSEKVIKRSKTPKGVWISDFPTNKKHPLLKVKNEQRPTSEFINWRRINNDINRQHSITIDRINEKRKPLSIRLNKSRIISILFVKKYNTGEYGLSKYILKVPIKSTLTNQRVYLQSFETEASYLNKFQQEIVQITFPKVLPTELAIHSIQPVIKTGSPKKIHLRRNKRYIYHLFWLKNNTDGRNLRWLHTMKSHKGYTDKEGYDFYIDKYTYILSTKYPEYEIVGVKRDVNLKLLMKYGKGSLVNNIKIKTQPTKTENIGRLVSLRNRLDNTQIIRVPLYEIKMGTYDITEWTFIPKSKYKKLLVENANIKKYEAFDKKDFNKKYIKLSLKEKNKRNPNYTAPKKKIKSPLKRRTIRINNRKQICTD